MLSNQPTPRRSSSSAEILALPALPLPVRLWEDPEDSGLRVDLLNGLGADSAAEQERALGQLAQRGLHVSTWAGGTIAGWADVTNLGRLLETDGDILVEAAAVVHPQLDVRRTGVTWLSGPLGESFCTSPMVMSISLANWLGPHGRFVY